jgi:hypothetical protein
MLKEFEYSKEELAVLQTITDMYRDIPEASLQGMSLRFNETKEVEACKSLEKKGLAETSPPKLKKKKPFQPDPVGSIWISVNKKGAEEIIRLFKVGILTKFEDREK